MNHAISNAGALEAAHYRAIEDRDAYNAAHDHLQDGYLDQLEADPNWLAELVFDTINPDLDALRAELFAAMVQHLVPIEHRLLAAPLGQMAKPLQQIIARAFADRADAEMAKRIRRAA